jgi:chemotaxis protein MotB
MAKKKEAHHGGAWKVAFADFMTAMMALFLVLWISSQDQEILIATSQYFQSPFKSPLENTSGVLPFESNATPRGNDGGSPEKNPVPIDVNALKALSREFYRLLNVSDNTPDNAIKVEITSDGLRVTIFDRNSQPLFKRDTAEFTEWGKMTMQNLAWLIDHDQFRVVIEGHTRAGILSTRKDYSDWDLSTDQVQAVRRSLVYYAVDQSRFDRLSGFGSTQPLPNIPPTDDSNQRIVMSLSMKARPSDQRDRPRSPKQHEKELPPAREANSEPHH